MMIAYTMSLSRGATDTLLFDVARRLQAQGRSLAGVVQINSDRPNGGRCDMDVQVLPKGPVLRISQVLGQGARGCRLNPDALETAVAATETQLSAGADCVIINKFGKQEAEGRGFRPVIAEALAADIPVIVGVNALNFEAFQEFSAGLAVQLPDDPQAILSWLQHGTADPAPQAISA